jgi:nucleotide-binding universal stress UspA family protein
MRQVVVGVDASDASVEAARFAGRLAQETGAELTVVYVRTTPFQGADQDLGVGELETYWQAAEQQAAQRTTQALVGCTAGWSFQVRAGDPAEQLEQVAREREAELLVVGGRGHTVVHRLLLGSVANRLLHHADRPVLVVR